VRVISNLLMAIGVIAIIIFALFLVGYILFQGTPEIKAEIGDIPVSAAAAQSYTDKYTAFETDVQDASAERVKKEVTITLTEEEVNSKIVELTAEGKFPFQDTLVSFKENECWIYLITDTPAANAKIGMILSPHIQNGGIKVDLLDFHIGKLPLPKSINETASDVINVLVNMENPANKMPVDLTSISIGDKTFTLKGMTRPAE
jgi:uncharacterized protein YpmS